MSAPDSGLSVANPVRHEVVEPPPLGTIQLPPDTPIAGGSEPSKEPRYARRRAVLVCHGMGQQVAFENIDLVASALENSARAGRIVRSPGEGGKEEPKQPPRARFAKLGDEWLPRAEVNLRHEGHDVDVHVYEAYWAPLTEGKVSAFAVTRFLVGAGLRGISFALGKRFDRWMFGRSNSFEVSMLQGLMLLLALVVVASALALYAALAGLLVLETAQFLMSDTFGGEAAQLTARLKDGIIRSPLALPFLLFPAAAPFVVLRRLFGEKLPKALPRVAALVGIALAIGLWSSFRSLGDTILSSTGTIPWVGEVRAWHVLAVVGVLSLAVGGYLCRKQRAPIGGTVAVASACVLGVWLVISGGLIAFDGMGLIGRSFTESTLETASSVQPLGRLAYGMLLVLAIAACIWLRSFYIQYLGDVAVYLSSHQLNVFHELRARIRDVGFRTACAIYGARNEEGKDWEYDEVVVVGHSLGSVVAYDTLNGVLNEDRVRGGELQAEERTRALVTFGSPLDKSAFIFRTQVGRSRFREALAAAVQPLVQPLSPGEDGPARGRTIPWRNVYSPFDPISGHLGYYDPPEGEDVPEGHLRVDNRVDARAGILGYAHVMYWDNPELNDYLYEQLAARELRVATAASATAG